jgi:hypothetical protein
VGRIDLQTNVENEIDEIMPPSTRAPYFFCRVVNDDHNVLKMHASHFYIMIFLNSKPFEPSSGPSGLRQDYGKGKQYGYTFVTGSSNLFK